MSGYLNSESLTEADLRDSGNRELVMTWGNAAFSGHYRDSFGPDWIIDAYLGHGRFRSDLIHLEHGRASGDDEGGTHDPVPDTLLFGAGLMSETRADLRATLHLGRATVTAGTQATRFEGHHEYYLTDLGLPDIIPLFSVFSSHSTRWRLSGYTRVQARLPNGFWIGTGLRLDRFQRPLIELAPYGELGYAASWWEVGVSASRSYQAPLEACRFPAPGGNRMELHQLRASPGDQRPHTAPLAPLRYRGRWGVGVLRRSDPLRHDTRSSTVGRDFARPVPSPSPQPPSHVYL